MKTEPRILAFIAADNSRRLSEQACEKAFRVAFPLNCEVEWSTSRNGVEYSQWGTVQMHGHGLRAMILNNKTNAKVWVSAYTLRMFYEKNTQSAGEPEYWSDTDTDTADKPQVNDSTKGE